MGWGGHVAHVRHAPVAPRLVLRYSHTLALMVLLVLSVVCTQPPQQQQVVSAPMTRRSPAYPASPAVVQASPHHTTGRSPHHRSGTSPHHTSAPGSSVRSGSPSEAAQALQASLDTLLQARPGHPVELRCSSTPAAGHARQQHQRRNSVASQPCGQLLRLAPDLVGAHGCCYTKTHVVVPAGFDQDWLPQ